MDSAPSSRYTGLITQCLCCKVVVTMNNTTLAYAAGLLDGEGHIGIHSSPIKAPYTHRRFNLRVEIGMTHKETILWLVNTFGFKLFIRQAVRPRKTAYFAHISSLQVVAFLTAVRPFSITKKGQIDIALSFHETCMAGHPKGKKLSASQISQREAFYLKMKKANDWGSGKH